MNNVELMPPYPTLFENISETDMWAEVNMSVASVPVMTKLVLPGMKVRKKGAVINIRSAGGLIPLLHIYTAAKVK